MRNFTIGVLVGLMLGGGIAWAALPDGRAAREKNKFVADSSGNTAIRIVFTN